MIDHVGKSQQENYPGLTVSRDGDAIVVRIPVRFHRRNGRQMVLTHGGSNGQATRERGSHGSLVAALAKAYRWQEQLESGEYASLEDLAAANGVDRTYAGRILQLASLAPEIVEAILDGNEPMGISLAKLRMKLPLIWAEQTWDERSLRTLIDPLTSSVRKLKKRERVLPEQSRVVTQLTGSFSFRT